MALLDWKLQQMKADGVPLQERLAFTNEYRIARDKGLSAIDALVEAELTAKSRDNLDDSDFALPGRRYPIHDKAHARNALARVAQHGTPAEQAKVKAAVHKKYPDIGNDDDKK